MTNGSSGNDASAAAPLLQSLGCLGLLAAVAMLCLIPLLLVEALDTALKLLNLSRPVATAALLGIILGSLINLPVYRFHRETLQPVDVVGSLGLGRFFPQYRRQRVQTVIAVNVGGCLVPLLLAIWEINVLLVKAGWPLAAGLAAVLINVAACYYAARPMAGVGIAMPAWLSPVVVLVSVWILLPPGFAEARPPVAFIAGVLGPLVGADLLHLKDISRLSTGLLSIGGAGTFDGIVLSGILATLLASWHPADLFA